MAIPSRHECLMIAAAQLGLATRSPNPEWVKAYAMTADAYISLAKAQDDPMNPEDEASWSPQPEGGTGD